MKNKNKLIIPIVLISSIIALITYLINKDIFGCFFLIIPSIYLAIETNVYFRQLKRIFWRLIFLIIQFFILIAFYSRMGGNGFLSFLADFLLLYFIFQFGESLYLLLRGSFQKIIKKKYSVVGLIILVLIIIGIPFSINRQIKTDKIINVAPPEVPGRANSCETDIVKAFDKNETLKISNQVQNTKLNWKDKKYETFVLDCPNEEESYNKVFLMKNNEGKIIFSMTDERFDKAEIKDINKDGVAELVVAHGNSGNCFNCQGQSVFQIVNDTVKDLFPDLAKPEGGKYANVHLSDINSDGIEDIMVTDDSWELHDGFSHANSPSHVQIITWKDGKYQPAGEMFSKYYLNQINERNQELNKLLKSKETGLSDIVSLAIENYWDYQEIGKNDEGYANFILQTSLETLLKTITINDSDKIWLLGIRNEIEKEYKEARPTIMPLY